MILSVIIPVYKVELTLNRCVESVLGQNVPDTEVILVDDGSPDNCPEMCDSWAEKDNRINVIHKKNGGLSDARNAGIAIAKGEYITFVDSDDYLHDGTLSPLMEQLSKNQDIDILEYMVKHDDSSRRAITLEDRTFSSAQDYWLTTKAWCHAYACNKIYKRQLFDNVRFVKGKLFEDMLLLSDILRIAKCVATTSNGYYNYCENTDGISKQVNISTVRQLLIAEAKAAIKMRTFPWSKNGKNLYYYMCCRCYDIIRLSFGCIHN